MDFRGPVWESESSNLNLMGSLFGKYDKSLANLFIPSLKDMINQKVTTK